MTLRRTDAEDHVRDLEIMRDGVLYADYLESKKRRKIIVNGRSFTGWPAIMPDEADEDVIFGVVKILEGHDIDTVYDDEDD